jgi:hypothetical protein
VKDLSGEPAAAGERRGDMQTTEETKQRATMTRSRARDEYDTQEIRDGEMNDDDADDDLDEVNGTRPSMRRPYRRSASVTSAINNQAAKEITHHV